jgi:hypothetical protein
MNQLPLLCYIVREYGEVTDNSLFLILIYGKL